MPNGYARLCALTTLLSAFLLFQVQPILSKWILPWFGGGPAIWTACVLFFQAVLFAGYAYAHASERWLPRTPRLVVHLALLAAAAAFIPVVPADAWKPADAADPTWRILALLAITVGAPYFLLSSTGPLVQAWMARAQPDRPPYRLYALSNAGSLGALLTYPFLVEPLIGLRTQSIVWSAAFAAFVLLSAAGAVGAWRLPVAASNPVEPESAPAWWHRALWILLPCFASWMLLASTQEMCEDVAVIPFLWIIPLALYLVSFILAFDHPRWYSPRLWAPLTALCAFAAVVFHFIDPTIHPVLYYIRVAALAAALFGLCMICHGELVRLKPGPARLTSFYLSIAAGGALGGAFVSLVAPRLFSTYAEWKIGIALTAALAWGLNAAIFRKRKVFAIALAGAGLIGVALIVFVLTWSRPAYERSRTFYGTLAVEPYDGFQDPCLDLVSGRILHGRQFPSDRRALTTYYTLESGVGRAIRHFFDREDMRVGVVGLGVGTIAGYGIHPTQTIRFYELNPDVERLARVHFRFLEDSAATVQVVLGDARLSLEREPPQRFHVLALDAFTGDAIPTHLLTVQAIERYLRHLDTDGVLAIHVTNRHIDLGPVVRGAARRLGLAVIDVVHEAAEPITSSRWMLCTRSESTAQALKRFESGDGGTREVVWTDDHSGIFSVLKWK